MAWKQWIRTYAPVEIKTIYRNVRGKIAEYFAMRKIVPAASALLKDYQITPEVLKACRNLYIKIWYDGEVMHLFTVDRVLPKYTDVLNVGCGTALDAPLIMKRNPGCRYTGIDTNEIAIAIAKTNLPMCRLIAGNFFEMNMQPQCYDLVICNSVIEHKSNYENMIGKLVSCARYEVILGFYRGLSDKERHDIQPVRNETYWNPVLGYGNKQLEYSYLNTYSERAMKSWLEITFPDWNINITHLVNPILKEFPSPTMVRLIRRD